MISKVELTDGLLLSRMVAGLWRLAEWDYSTQDLIEWIEACLEMGITTFDHADIYGDYECEALFGKAIKLKPSLRKKMQIVTKCGIKLTSSKFPERRINHYDTSASHIIASAENSLRNLATEQIDLLLIHRPDALMKADEVAQAFTELRDMGKVQHFGVSNFSPAQYDLLASRLDFPLVTNQIEFSVLHIDPAYDGSLDHAQQHRYKPMIWSPFGGGSIFNGDDDRAKRLRETLTNISADYGNVGIDQIALAWILRHPSQPIPVLGSSKIERIQSATNAAKIALSREAWHRIWVASAGHGVP